mmetsp:Transcript_14204/g.28337  ORF Transcript_14204/g.28337 Transcript_14204/m.28337 type:complete len:347 (+) Transcript_14204:1046-2086(+)|eukprot:CAMPEP_0194332810 /NCGR_PEP_ID=MMETSP0171-20130528/60430_1 /TAXON_ID=218684 /ORGANISM="Corethron pennatum, Strain L29A3" /LENGTH=346 /DNA_ID=CAMNT_0039094807 /DNA_START=1031 /DNA_END=2071 /DNA_ORIENTATION=-
MSFKKIAATIDEALNIIASLLNQSQDVRNNVNERKKLLLVNDLKPEESLDSSVNTKDPRVKILNEENSDNNFDCFRQDNPIKPEQEKFVSDRKLSKKSKVNHALHFHLRKNIEASSDDIDASSDTLGCESERTIVTAREVDSAKNVPSIKILSDADDTKKNSKYQTRERLFQLLEEHQQTEMRLEDRIQEIDPDEENETDQNLSKELQSCRAKNCKNVLSILAAYKPKINHKYNDNSSFDINHFCSSEKFTLPDGTSKGAASFSHSNGTRRQPEFSDNLQDESSLRIRKGEEADSIDSSFIDIFDESMLSSIQNLTVKSPNISKPATLKNILDNNISPMPSTFPLV